MSYQTLSLPAASQAKNGILIKDINYKEVYSICAIFEAGFIFRTISGQLIVRYFDGLDVPLANTFCSPSFENNFYHDAARGKFIYLTKEGQDKKDCFVAVFDLATKNFIKKAFVITTVGYPSISIDVSTNNVWLYQSLLDVTIETNAAWISSYNYFDANGQPADTAVSHLFDTNWPAVFSPDTQICFFLCFSQTGRLFRSRYSFLWTDMTSIGGQALNEVLALPTTPAGWLDLYKQAPFVPVGINIVGSAATAAAINHIHYVEKADAIIGFDVEYAKTSSYDVTTGAQIVSNFSVELYPPRVNLVHNKFYSLTQTPGYPRFYQSMSTDFVYDTRSTSNQHSVQIGSMSAGGQNSNYPICSGNLPLVPLFSIKTLQNSGEDKINQCIYANGTQFANIGGNIFKLNFANSCQIDKLSSSPSICFSPAEYIGDIDKKFGTLIPDEFLQTTFWTGLKTLWIDEKIRISNNDFAGSKSIDIGYRLNTALTNSFYYNFVTNPNLAVSFFSAIKFENHLYQYFGKILLVLNVNTGIFLILNTPTNPTIPTFEVVAQQLVYNDTVYFITKIGIVSAKKTSTTNFTQQFNSVSYEKLAKVKLLANKFTNELYLYDSDLPSNLYKVSQNTNLLKEDFTTPQFKENFCTVITKTFSFLPEIVSSNDFELYFINETDIVIFLYDIGEAAVVLNFLEQTNVAHFNAYQNMPGIGIQVFPNKIQTNRARGYFDFFGKTLVFTDFDNLKLHKQIDTSELFARQFVNNIETMVRNYAAVLTTNSEGKLLLNAVDSQLRVKEFEFINISLPYLTTNLPNTLATKIGLPVNRPLHWYCAIYSDKYYYIPIDCVSKEDYDIEETSYAEVQNRNNATNYNAPQSINGYKRLKTKYTIRYEVSEKEVTYFVNLFHQYQYYPGERIDIWFGNEIDSANFAQQIVLTNVNYSFVSHGAYVLNLNFETI